MPHQSARLVSEVRLHSDSFTAETALFVEENRLSQLGHAIHFHVFIGGYSLVPRELPHADLVAKPGLAHGSRSPVCPMKVRASVGLRCSRQPDCSPAKPGFEDLRPQTPPSEGTDPSI